MASCSELLRFGTAAALLGMIPFASIPIQFTNMVGAALWAANLEKGVSTQTEISEATSLEETSSQDRKEL